MIAYFTGCGSSRHVAERLGESTSDSQLFDIGRWMHNGGAVADIDFKPEDNELLGIVTPVYFWGLPTPVIEFLDRLNVTTKPSYVYTVVTYGTSTGGATSMLRELLAKHSLHVDASYIVKTVDVWTPMFNVADKNKNRMREIAADKKIESIAGDIDARHRGNGDCIRIWSPIAALYYRHYKDVQLTSYFNVNRSRCTGCGTCARNCPVKAITMVDGKACFTSQRCAACLRCLHHCHAFAITRGKRSIRNGQYVWGGNSTEIK